MMRRHFRPNNNIFLLKKEEMSYQEPDQEFSFLDIYKQPCNVYNVSFKTPSQQWGWKGGVYHIYRRRVFEALFFM